MRNIVTDAAQVAPDLPETAPLPQEVHLKYLDGLRGFAALYVVISHVTQILGDSGGSHLPKLVQAASFLFHYGYYAVAIFIVLSGYCLMLPVVNSPDQELRGGFHSYILRRAKRILPPYYAALAFSVILIALLHHRLHSPQAASETNAAFSTLTLPVILSHLLMLQNVRPEWASKINPPMWSVATEWQIYFLFPTVLLPLWRRFGSVIAIAAGFVMGVLPFALPGMYFHHASLFYLGLFAGGMAGASIGFSKNPRDIALRSRLPWVFLSGAFWLLWFLLGLKAPPSAPFLLILSALVGTGTVCLIVACTRYLTSQRLTAPPLAVRILDASWAVRLGAFSYSLYLVHQPILWAASALLLTTHLSYTLKYTVMMLVAVPVAVLFAYLFHLMFERPFTRSAVKTKLALPHTATAANPKG